jgi:hypothetical protein
MQMQNLLEREPADEEWFLSGKDNAHALIHKSVLYPKVILKWLLRFSILINYLS